MTVLILTPTNSVKGNTVVPSLLMDPFFERWDFLLGVDDIRSGLAAKLDNRAVVLEAAEQSLREILSERPIDILVSLGWGKIIPDWLISSVRVAAINCHSSFLPDYKGASVYRFYWAHAERFSGATIHFLTSEVDGGNIIAQERFLVSSHDKPADILRKASELTAPLLREALLKVTSGYHGFAVGEGRMFPRRCSRFTLRTHRVVNVIRRRLGLQPWTISHRLR